MAEAPSEQRGPNSVRSQTRRAIIDFLTMGRSWSGQVGEVEFLARLYNLREMPSNDYRYQDAEGDIYKHRHLNDDGDEDWVFSDPRFDLLYGPDIPFLRFVAETIHPKVRRDTEEVEAMLAEFNTQLAHDGWELFASGTLAGRPTFSSRRRTDSMESHLEDLRAVSETLGESVAKQVRRLRHARDGDPDLAIGTAKEVVETVCKSILKERQVDFSNDIEVPALVSLTVRSLPILPPAIVADPEAEKSVRVLVNSLGSIAGRLAEIRNDYGTGHGRESSHAALDRHHGHLAVGAATTLVTFLFECHSARRAGSL